METLRSTWNETTSHPQTSGACIVTDGAMQLHVGVEDTCRR